MNLKLSKSEIGNARPAMVVPPMYTCSEKSKIKFPDFLVCLNASGIESTLQYTWQNAL